MPARCPPESPACEVQRQTVAPAEGSVRGSLLVNILANLPVGRKLFIAFAVVLGAIAIISLYIIKIMVTGAIAEVRGKKANGGLQAPVH